MTGGRSRHPRPPGRRRGTATLLGAVVILVTAGCSSAGPSTPGLPSYTPGAASATSTGATATATGGDATRPPLGYAPGDPAGVGSWAEVGGSGARTPAQTAALRAWTTYWRITLQAYNTAGANLSTPAAMKALDAVATPAARNATLHGVATRRQHHGFTVGGVAFTVAEVKVTGNTATVRGCADDRSYEVGAGGEVVVPAPGSAPFADTLVRSGSRWLVSQTPSLPGTCPS